jgi:dTDP-4-dehydrorhamnose reductase
MKKNYLATGAAGMVGSYLPPHVERTDRSQLDVTDTTAVFKRLKQSRPYAVLHLAAATDVDRCQSDRMYAFRGNTLGTLNVALACRELNIRLLYVSTGGVFSGTKLMSSETDEPDPQNFYSWTKLEGERIVEALIPRALIVRAGWIMGGGALGDHKFVGAMVRAFRTREHVNVINDRFGSPTYALHLVETCMRLLDTNQVGLWHCADSGVCSRFEMAAEIAKLMRYSGSVLPISSDAFPTAAPRGVSEGLDCGRLKDAGYELPDWRTALRAYLMEFPNV